MKGYYKNKEATKTSMKNGWFHSGDLAVVYPNGYIQVKARSKDIIISGGENISSVEVENIITKHEAVSLVAVVAKPDDKWGEAVTAVVELKSGKLINESQIIDICKQELGSVKAPKAVHFWDELPRSAVGKVRKKDIRDYFWEGFDRRI